MPRLRYSHRSRTDLENIWGFIAVDSPRQASEVLSRFHAKIELLRRHPLTGHRHRELQAHLRCLNSDGYLIFYRYTAGIVCIDRIVHHSMDLPSLSLEDL
jgi:toxin ParE1/3/4